MDAHDNLVLDLPGDVFAGRELCIATGALAELHENANRLVVSANTAATEAAEAAGRVLSGKKLTFIDTAVFAQLSDKKSVLINQINDLKELAAAQYRIELSYPDPQSVTLVDVSVPSVCQPAGPTFNPGCTRCCAASVISSVIGSDRAGMISLFCPFCGAGYFCRDDDFTAALAFLWRAELAQKISKVEKLLSIVIAAVTVFLRAMRTATAVPFAIAVSQRQFFTHHGAHPPTERSLGSPGLFVGRGFQPAAA